MESTSASANMPSTSASASMPSTSASANMPSTSASANMPSTSAFANMPSTSVSDFNNAEKESRQKINDLVDMFDAVIEANRRLDQKYGVEEAILMKKLQQVQAELQVHKEQTQVKPEHEKQDSFRYYSVGRPYFKDKDQNPPPDNEDTIIMKQFQMYDFSNVMTVSGWTVGDKNRLLSVLLDLSKDTVKNKIYSEINKLKRIKPKTDEITAKVEELQNELVAVNNKSLEDFDPNIDEEFDWEEIALKLNKRHSSREYKAIWELFFHPRVNKREWTPKEHQALQRIAAEKRMQDWESIAKTLNTGRTAYQCFVYFRTNVNHAASGRRWTKTEMNYLQRVIGLYKEENYIPWGKVAASMNNRTKIQCYNKYMGMVEGRKGRFLPEEDSVILNFVNVYGTDFRKMSSFLTGRSAVQLRVRYNLLLKMRVSITWTVEDDRKLLQIIATQDCRTNFATATKHFPGKDRHHIRSRYNTLMRWSRKYPNSDISTAPRRAARKLYHGEPKSNLLKAIENLRNKMQAELQTSQAEAKKRVRKLTRDSSESAIHDALLATISTLETRNMRSASVVHKTQKAKVEGTYQTLEVQDISSTPDERVNYANVRRILVLLNANLADEAKFYSSDIGKEFKKIEEQRPKGPTQPILKSYSKKEVEVEERLVEPTLFGSTAGRRRFAFPPNFATITGSRVILNHLNSAREKPDRNLKLVARRDVVLQAHLTQLRERFIDLFSWPNILAGQPPEYYKLCAADMIRKRASSIKPVPRPLPGVPGVTIPPPPPRHLRDPARPGTSIDSDAMDVDENLISLKHTFDRTDAPFSDDAEDEMEF